MFIIDPQTPPATPTNEPAVDEVVAAIDAGLAAEAGNEPPAAPTNPAADAAAALPSAEGDEAPNGDAPDDAAAVVDPANPEAAKPDAAAKPEGEGKADGKSDAIEAEVASLNLREKAAERFRELAADREQMAPLREAMKAVGIDDPAIAAQALSRVRDADYMISRVIETGADSEQYDKTLNYLALVNKTGDIGALEQAYELMLPEFTFIAKALGKDISGLVDPLEGHDDLRTEVENGDMTRARAVEIARSRQHESLRQGAEKATRAADERKSADEQLRNDGRIALNELGADLEEADPERYKALAPALLEKVREITQKFPPSEWAMRAARAYALLPLPTPAPAADPTPTQRPPVGHVPMRPTGGRPALTPTTFDDPMEALDFGIGQVSR